MVEGVLGVWVGAVLGIVKRFVMFELVCRGLEKESWQMLVSRVSTRAQRRAVLGRFSSSMIAACRELWCSVCVWVELTAVVVLGQLEQNRVYLGMVYYIDTRIRTHSEAQEPAY